MDASTVATILGAVGFSGIAAATINFFANRKRVAHAERALSFVLILALLSGGILKG